MQKKKEKFIHRLGKLLARTWLINIPAVFILLVLMIIGELDWLSAFLSLLCFYGFSAFIIFFVFKDLDDFIFYLNKVAEGVGAELPKFKKSLFSSKRLANAYQSVSSLWQRQALSDTLILKKLPDPLLMTTPTHKVVFMNESALHLFGAKAMHQNIFSLFKMPLSPTAKIPHFFQWETMKKNHKLYYYVRNETLSYPTRLGATHTFLLHDMTSFEEFHRQQADFFANASHELKTPLAILSGAIETLQGPAQNDPHAQQKFLTLMAKQTHHMNELIQSFLNLAQLQQNHQPHPMEKVNMNDFLADLCQNLQSKAQQKQQHLSLMAGRSPVVWGGQPLDMKYICQNLVDNALKYAPERATIQLKLHLHKKSFFLEVYNSGSYIAPAYRQVIFERFYRINQGLKNTPEGSGLGLNIVAYLVQKYHGKITVKSSPTKGTTFRVSFPLSS